MKKQNVINYINKQIEEGRWKEGDKIFSEWQFTNELKVSAGTVREALKYLENKGIIRTVKESGSYVAKTESESKKSILILTNKNTMTHSDNIYIKLFHILTKKIQNAGYTPLAYSNEVFSLEETFGDKFKEIGGVICIFPNKKDLNFIKKKQLPIVNAISVHTFPEPTVIVNYNDLIGKILNIIQEKRYKKVLVFPYFVPQNKPHSNTAFLVADKYFSKYTVMPPMTKEQEVSMAKLIQKIDFTPDLMVFLDEHLYNLAQHPIERNEFLKNTKIITHHSFFEINDPTVTKITFDLDEIASKGLNLLIKQMKGEYISDYNIFINSKIEG
ncbi:MAG: winged helix-turn-helix transcriptional regulator [Abditibacteriota bacterium]|nr:winged helix-turn-helix transcriptional regulator [Abditibacteriota bacterium]